jgi:pimeloyl-ACP methyl ester carboxylesterase
MKKIVGATFAFIVWLLFRGRPEPLEIPANLGGGKRTAGADGRIFSRSVGDGSDLLLLPGFAGNSQTWEFITPDLASDHRVHVVDLLGHGLSDKPASARYDGVAHAGRLVEWLGAHGLSNVVVVASSSGCQTAVQFAADHQQFVRGLVLINPFLIARPGIRFLLDLARMFPMVAGFAIRRIYAQRWFTWLGKMLGHGDPWRVTSGDVDRQYWPYGTPGFFDALPAMLNGIDPSMYSSVVPRVKCPVLLVWGARDRTARSESVVRLAREFPHGEAVILENAGHMAQEEVPDDLIKQIRSFLKSIEA